MIRHRRALPLLTARAIAATTLAVLFQVGLLWLLPAHAFMLPAGCDPNVQRCEPWITRPADGQDDSHGSGRAAPPQRPLEDRRGASNALALIGAEPILAAPPGHGARWPADAVALCAGEAHACDPEGEEQLIPGAVDVVAVFLTADTPGGVRALPRLQARFVKRQAAAAAPAARPEVFSGRELIGGGLAAVAVILLLILWAVFRRRPEDEFFQVDVRHSPPDDPASLR